MIQPYRPGEAHKLEQHIKNEICLLYVIPKTLDKNSDFLASVHRLAKGIPPQLASAIEMPDLCFLPTGSETLSIEIKVKKASNLLIVFFTRLLLSIWTTRFLRLQDL